MLWDVKNAKQIARVLQSRPANLVAWAPPPAGVHLFATAHDTQVKLWDARKFDASSELYSAEVGASALKQLQFDPVFGQLLLAQDKQTVRLLRASDLFKLDEYTNKKQLLSSQFLPFKGASSPGVIALPDRSSNFIYL